MLRRKQTDIAFLVLLTAVVVIDVVSELSIGFYIVLVVVYIGVQIYGSVNFGRNLR